MGISQLRYTTVSGGHVSIVLSAVINMAIWAEYCTYSMRKLAFIYCQVFTIHHFWPGLVRFLWRPERDLCRADTNRRPRYKPFITECHKRNGTTGTQYGTVRGWNWQSFQWAIARNESLAKTQTTICANAFRLAKCLRIAKKYICQAQSRIAAKIAPHFCLIICQLCRSTSHHSLQLYGIGCASIYTFIPSISGTLTEGHMRSGRHTRKMADTGRNQNR